MSLDIAKSIAIIAIVAGHVWRGLASAGLLDGDSILFNVVDRSLYMFHLSVFAFTAGLFVQRGMNRAGAWRYAMKRDAEFLWIYVLWSFISGGTKLALSSAVNHPTSVPEILTLWIPSEQYWFFGWIALMMILSALVQPWRSTARAISSLTLVTLGSLVMWGIGGTVIGTQGLGLAFFFWVALIVRGDRLLGILKGMSLPVAVLVAVFSTVVMLALVSLTGATTPTEGAAGRTAVNVLLGVLAATAGVVAVLLWSSVLARADRRAEVFQYIGQRSMAVFIAHVLFMAAARIVLLRLGVDQVGLHLLIGVVIGVGGPLMLLWLSQLLRVQWLFSAPQWLTRRV
ncbi:acyltransferase family protein [Micrococcus lacusdianchii]|nr:acyltransferase family protein [Micrococcus sp. JXJ CY 30]